MTSCQYIDEIFTREIVNVLEGGLVWVRSVRDYGESLQDVQYSIVFITNGTREFTARVVEVIPHRIQRLL
jgi:hypothetical protein